MNRYVEERAPWQLARDAADSERLDETLASIAEGLRVVSALLHPYMPACTELLLTKIGASSEASYASARFAEVGSGARVSALEPLFPKRS
jgi:methionyl-tRNA synthetase